jgi:hypothetical protein
MFITIVILVYLDKDTKWENYLWNSLIHKGNEEKPEELTLAYDGFTKQITLQNHTS